ncbi:GYD domain protein [Symmachiella macrocystis]|uniref:GYD domain protein n=1 Tax=Symmachiella macrocystis TaxID=2527985 RepID=A0A5C6BK72_9PLAN|nr:GYD domain-containing protein [Symmachiella macrocystis]TWU12122.1 GYD domain protein [Symmachiella macrocystis]
MKTATIALLAIGLLAEIGNTQDTPLNEPPKPMRIFLFSAKPSPAAWQFMKKNPGDRRAATVDAIKNIGGKMLGYYWGLTTGKNYIIVAVPDGRTAQAMLIQRLSSGLVL